MTSKQALELLKKEDVDGFNEWVKQRRKKGKKAVDLDDQNLSGLKLRRADLRDAHLNGCNLRGCDLEGADLRNARLRQADLRKANLTRADLSHANLKQSKRKGTVFKKANLDDVKGL